jgi:predicted transcriptional regulator
MPRSKQHHAAKPATKKDIRLAVDELAAATQKGFTEVNERFTEIDERFTEIDGRFTEINGRFTEIEAKIDTMKEEIIHEFKALAENIHQDVAGANHDEISLIKEQLIPDHEARIQILEKNSGIPVSPHY